MRPTSLRPGTPRRTVTRPARIQGLIFVVDCADKERIDEARRELHKIINDREMKEAIILIFANKQDVKGGGSLPFVFPPRGRGFVPRGTKATLGAGPTDPPAPAWSLSPSAALTPEAIPDMLGLHRIRDRNWCPLFFRFSPSTALSHSVVPTSSFR